MNDAYPGQRIFDLVVLAVVAIPASAALALAGAGVALTSGLPVLFRQQRVGQFGREFTLYKLRTMRNTPMASLYPDRRDITPIGRLLRRTSIDELPQLVLVAAGRMSIVGPRPAPPALIAAMDVRQRNRLNVRPGLTGLAQVAGRNRLTWSERVELDIKYVHTCSLSTDISIVFRTIWVVIRGRGAGGHPVDDPMLTASGGPDG